jgi:hypothetical protein
MTVPTEPGKHCGKLAPKYIAVLEALLFKALARRRQGAHALEKVNCCPGIIA